MSNDHGAPPVIPTDLLPYESYTEDPKWQGRFTMMWGIALALAIVLAAPRAFRLRSLRQSLTGLLGIRVRDEYERVPMQDDDGREGRTTMAERKAVETGNPVTTLGRVLDSMRLWNVPGIPLNVGQMVVVAGYAAFALVCIVLKAPLMENPNRAGFLALAQLTPVFLFASKNSPLTALLLGPGADYTKLNYIHRWSARFLFLGAVVHGSLWINNHLIYDLPILTQQKEGSGVAALGCLCVIVLTSIAPVRRWCYSAFLLIHFLVFPAFFITVCYHTIYATPWIFPPLAFYGADLLFRLFRWRVVVGNVEAKAGGMSLIHIPLATNGWRAGQHVQVRAMIGGRAWEGHPLSVCCAAPDVSCLRAPDGGPIGMLLAARSCGDWTRSLHNFGLAPEDDAISQPAIVEEDADAFPGREAHFILEGPYGGPTLRAGDYERVLLFAGGSGVTFTLAVLDELVGRCVRQGRREGEKTRRVVWCWCVRSFGAISWFAPQLLQIATLAARPDSGLDLRIRIFVTCLCDPDAVPDIPGCSVTEARPVIGTVLNRLLDSRPAPGVDCCGIDQDSSDESEEPSRSASTEDLSKDDGAEDLEKGQAYGTTVSGAGGVAVFAAGPGSLIREAGNAVAAANLGRGRAAGGVAFSGEVFTI
ncbi:hypothetical protein B0H16DRAFT_1385845 [Mycena metata]|uniref:FAD-binding FR-type domain-containing protein n=1 Tax=Mycena metata TaxID=1033252 RepID=A0AAD7HK64_9AGAR|nr:hypothetical protein B0H16DRAFT_1385845 [Mycena metata]